MDADFQFATELPLPRSRRILSKHRVVIEDDIRELKTYLGEPLDMTRPYLVDPITWLPLQGT